jgi:hypothetical protein
MLWKIVLAIGILGVLLGLLATGATVALPLVTEGRVSWEEAVLGIIPAVLFLGISFLIFVLGLIFVIKNRKKV